MIILLIPINNNIIFVNKRPMEIEKNSYQLEKIKTVWDNFIKDNHDYFNGDIYVVTDYDISNQYKFTIGKAKYADLIYAKEYRDLTIRSLFSGIIFETRDSYYLLIKNRYGIINLIGGTASKMDFIKDTFNPFLCLKREVYEEIGLNIEDKNDIIEYKEKYIKIPNGNENMCSIGIIYEGKLNYTKKELIKIFNINKDKLDTEIDQLLFYNNDNYLDLESQKKVSYIMELFEKLIENK